MLAISNIPTPLDGMHIPLLVKGLHSWDTTVERKIIQHP